MFFWFVGTAILTVAFVFRDPAFDYRLLIVGSVLPLSDAVWGGARALHSITVTIALLAVIMVATSGRRPIRRLLLGLPIGMLLHLVFDAAWTDTDTFWWPFTGVGFTSEELPEAARWPWGLALEAIGLVLCGWLWRENAFNRRERRAAFLSTGRLRVLGTS